MPLAPRSHPAEHPFWLRPDAPAAAYALVEPLRLEIETLQVAVEVASEQAAEALASAQRATAEAHARRAQVAWAGGRVAQLENALKEAGQPVPPPVKPPPPPPEAKATAPQKIQAVAPATAPDNERSRAVHLEKELHKARQELVEVARQRDAAQRALESQNALASGAGRRASRGGGDDPPQQEASQGELVKALNAERQRAQRAEELAKQLTEMLKRLEEASRASAAAAAAAGASAAAPSAAATTPAGEAALLRKDLAAARAKYSDLEAEVQSLRLQQGQGGSSRGGQGQSVLPSPNAPVPLNSRGLGGGKSLVPPGAMSPAEIAALRDRAEHAEADAAALKEQLGAATRRASVLEGALAQAPARPGQGQAAVPAEELQRLQSRCRALQAKADEASARIAELESLLMRPDSRMSDFSTSNGGTMSAAPSPVPSPGSTPSSAKNSAAPTPSVSPPGSSRSGSSTR